MPSPAASAGGRAAEALRHRDVCLATGTTEDFVPGTFVLVTSFLKQHPAFGGDIVILHDDLCGASRDALLSVSGQVRLEPVSRALRSRLRVVASALPAIGRQMPQFFSLEAFRLAEHRKVLFCDSDLLFRGPVDELFDAPEALLAVGDIACLRGVARDASRFDYPPRRGVPALQDTFNAGFLLIDQALTSGACYADLLEMLVPETWDGVVSSHTDQLLLNRYFAGRQTLVALTYNYPVPDANEIRQRHALGPESAKVLHFLGHGKPWQMATMLEKSPSVAAYQQWYDAWTTAVASVHLQRKLRVPGAESARS